MWPAEYPSTRRLSSYTWYILFGDVFYPTKSVQINIMIGNKAPNPYFISLFIKNSLSKILVWNSAV